MKRFVQIVVTACVASLALMGATVQSAWALRESNPVSTDTRIQTIVYNPNEVYKFTGHYGYQSLFEFEDGEEIGTISLGDSISWQISPSGSRLFLKPVEEDATTNMTIVTSKRVYHFELHAEHTESINDPSMVFVLRFIYGRGAGISVSSYIDSVPDPLAEPEKYNFDYSISGPEEISPIRIFDDGTFTYFEFRDKNAEIPAFFLVHGDGSESLINFRTRGDYIVVERVAAQFTLRHGQDSICVFNNVSRIQTSGPTPRPNDKKGWFTDEVQVRETPAVSQAPLQSTSAPASSGSSTASENSSRPPIHR